MLLMITNANNMLTISTFFPLINTKLCSLMRSLLFPFSNLKWDQIFKTVIFNTRV